MKKLWLLASALMLTQILFSQVKTVKISQEAPEIKLPGVSGDSISLAGMKGKVILIDFWASWCVPCRQNNPNLVKLYEEFKDQEFEIFGVSIDKDEDAWKKAISQDHLIWTQVYDNKGWYAQSTFDYGLEAIPASFLIDKEGKIRGINLEKRKLEKKIHSLLK